MSKRIQVNDVYNKTEFKNKFPMLEWSDWKNRSYKELLDEING